MASNELTIPGGEHKLTAPAYLQQAYGEAPSNIITDDRGNTLSVRGKVFAITAEGETTQLTRTDPETQEEFPLQALPVVILDYGVRQGRSFYEGSFDPNETKEPTCWSKDGILPDESVAEKQSEKCATCHMAVKGSKVTDNNKPTTACAPHRILAVVPIKRLDLDPLRLRIAQTSDYDGRSPDLKAKGMFAFKNYLDTFKSRGIRNTKEVVTSISFDPNAAYPKLLFRAVRYVTEDEHARILDIMASGKVEDLLGDTGTAFAARPALPGRAPQAAIEHKPAPAAAAVKAAAAPAAAPADEDEDERIIREAQERKAAKEAAAKAAAAAPKPTAPAEFTFRGQEAGEDDDDYTIAKAQARKAHMRTLAAAAAPAQARAPFPAFTEVAGEDEDDTLIRKAGWNKARKAYEAGGEMPVEYVEGTIAAGAARVAQPMTAAAAPVRERGKPAPGKQRRTTAEVAEDNAADAAEGKQAVAEEVPKGQEKPAEKFLPNALNGSNMGDDDEDAGMAIPGAAAAAPAKATAAARPAPTRTVAAEVPAGVPADVAGLLTEWGEE